MHLVPLVFALLLTVNAEVISSGDAPPSKTQTSSKRRTQKARPNAPGESQTPDPSKISTYSPQAFVPPSYKNGAGETGVKWDSGTPTVKSPPQNFEAPDAGKCGIGQDLWGAARKVMSETVIPQHRGYNLMAPAWPHLVSSAGDGGSFHCEFGGNKQSMCTSATAAALCQHFSDLLRSKAITLTPAQIRFLNSSAVKAAVNGNTFSIAKLIQGLGGRSMFSGASGGVKAVLKQARTGDLLRFDRNNGTGHSTIFKDADDVQFCYWSSNTATMGVGVQCEYIGVISQVVVSRFPGDLNDFGAKVDNLQRTFAGFSASVANTMGTQGLSWASQLDCTPLK